eukprot:CAMPEP_0116863036 /NCGR_PEP_ID=MMETSP0418-20121206/23983_1 /TAXON_ID=1158023 /ORGANISM="Astrosyne radiata, Strain 13vi08-1A" /LENGTH=364 /DNA_ID=CAMNT_0004497981 /DNA_START=32 /DNA_END=1126 /DNA_ORIENTATION=-
MGGGSRDNDSDDEYTWNKRNSKKKPDDDDDDAEDPPSWQSGRQEQSSFSFSSCCDNVWKQGAWCVVVLLLLIMTVVLISVSLQRLKSTQYGVQYNRFQKTLNDAVKRGGLHAGPPGYSFIKFPATFITVDLPTAVCVSQDGLRVVFSVTFQYQMPKEWLLDAILRYRDFERWATVVEAAGNSAVQHSCSDFQISNFQNQRGVIQSRMEENLRKKLEGTKEDGSDGVYARAVSLQLRNVDLPGRYRDAVAKKQQAAEDITLAQNQRTQERTKAETDLLSAREEAKKINDTATNDASVTLTEANLKAQETLFALETEAEVLKRVKANLNLTTDGLLAYLANDFVAEVPELHVKAAEPAKFSQSDEL